MEPATAPASDPPPASTRAKPRRRAVSPATLTRISEAAAVAAVEAFYGAKR